MPKVSVWVPDELMATVRQELPDLNLSATLRAAVEQLLECEHRSVICAACATAVDVRAELVEPALANLYTDAMDRIEVLVRDGRTAEGAARVLKDVGQRHGIARAERRPLPRPNRSDRARAAARAAGEISDLPKPDERNAA